MNNIVWRWWQRKGRRAVSKFKVILWMECCCCCCWCFSVESRCSLDRCLQNRLKGHKRPKSWLWGSQSSTARCHITPAEAVTLSGASIPMGQGTCPPPTFILLWLGSKGRRRELIVLCDKTTERNGIWEESTLFDIGWWMWGQSH